MTRPATPCNPLSRSRMMAFMQAIPYFIPRQTRIHFWAAYQWLFASRNRWMNLLYASVCQLIPIAGPMVLSGWLIEVLVPRTAEEWPGWDGKGPYPDFTFDRFMPYLQRGVWPFLVSLIASLVIAIPAGVIMVMAVVAVVGSSLLATPAMIRAALLQDFGAAFAFPWIKDFLARTWKELLMETVFLGLTAIPMMVLGYAMCFVGLYAATALLTIAHWHLNLQIYRLFVARGGAPIVPKGFPPPIPAG